MSDSHSEEDDRTVVVSNISPQLNQSHVRELFTMVGHITALSFSQEQGRAFIEFDKLSSARAAVFLSGTQLGDRSLQVILKSNLPQPPTEEEIAAAKAKEAEEAAAKAKEAEAAAAAAAAAAATAAATAAASAAATATAQLSGAQSLLPTPASTSLLPGVVPSPSPSPATPLLPFQQLMASNPALAAFAQQQAQLGVPPGAPAGTAPVDPTSTSRTIYVGNLGPEVTELHLRQFFLPIGYVVATKFSEQKPSSTVRYAFVEFLEQSSANQAVASWNGAMMGDRSIRVGKAQNSITKMEPAALMAGMGAGGAAAGAASSNAPLIPGVPAAPASASAPLLPSPTAILEAADPKVAAAMEKVRQAQEAIARKLTEPAMIPGMPMPMGMGVPPFIPAAAAPSVANSLLSALGYGPPAAPAVNLEESKVESSSRDSRRRSRHRDRSRSRSASSSSSSSRSRSRSKSRSRSRSRSRSHRRPDYAERKREREQREREQRERERERAGDRNNDRWGGGPAPRSRSPPRRDHYYSTSSSSSRYDHRDRDRDRYYQRRHRSRSRSPRDRRDRNPHRRLPGAAAGKAGKVWDGFQWQPKTDLPPAPPAP